MTYEDNNAIYALNSYLWKVLEANLGWAKSNYQGAVPIIPIAQQPELIQSGSPFIVYGSSIHPAQHLYSLRTESVSYVIYSKSSTEVNKIIDLLAETFERQDDSARDVNLWLDTESIALGIPWGIGFATVKVAMTEPSEPAEQEGGWVAGTIMLEARYTISGNSPITSGFTP